MNRLLSTAVVAASLLGGTLYAASAARETYPTVSTMLTVDRVACGPVTKWDGGDMRVEVIHEKGNVLKHRGLVQSAQASFEVPFPSAKPLMDLIADLCADRQKRVALVLADVPSNPAEASGALEVQNAILTEVRFPAFSLAAKDPLRVTLVFQGEHSQFAAPAPPGPSTPRKNFAPANFRFDVPGADLTGVSRVEAFTIKRKVVFDDPGDSGGATTIHAVPTEFPDSILVTLPPGTFRRTRGVARCLLCGKPGYQWERENWHTEFARRERTHDRDVSVHEPWHRAPFCGSECRTGAENDPGRILLRRHHDHRTRDKDGGEAEGEQLGGADDRL